MATVQPLLTVQKEANLLWVVTVVVEVVTEVATVKAFGVASSVTFARIGTGRF